MAGGTGGRSNVWMREVRQGEHVTLGNVRQGEYGDGETCDLGYVRQGEYGDGGWGACDLGNVR